MITIEQYDYGRPKQARRLEAFLSKIFRNPKDLRLTAPNLRYPFDFRQWARLYASGAPYRTFVMTEDNWIAGHISLRLYTTEGRGHIHHLIVDPAQRNQGYARRLIQHAEREARELGFPRMTLYVVPSNLPAIRLYQSLGYTEIDRTRDHHLVLGKSLID